MPGGNIVGFAVTVVLGADKFLKLKLDDTHEVNIPVSDETWTYFKSFFKRDNPSSLQKQKYATIMKMVHAAYLKGLEDGRR